MGGARAVREGVQLATRPHAPARLAAGRSRARSLFAPLPCRSDLELKFRVSDEVLKKKAGKKVRPCSWLKQGSK